jgi:O-antigen/teichoic acid export membrane protein
VCRPSIRRVTNIHSGTLKTIKLNLYEIGVMLKSLLKNSKTYRSVFVVKIASLAVSFAWISFILNSTSLAALGSLMLAIFYSNAVFLFASFGLSEYLLRFFTKFGCHTRSTYFGAQFLLQLFVLLLGGAIWLLLLKVGNIELDFKLMLLLTQLVAWRTVKTAELRSRGKASLAALLDLLLPMPIFITIGLLLGMKSEFFATGDWLICIYAASVSTSLIIAELLVGRVANSVSVPDEKTSGPNFILREGHFFSLLKDVVTNWKEVATFYIANMVMFANMQGDRALIPLVLEPSVFALYSIAQKLGSVASFGLNAFNLRSKPDIARAVHRGDLKHLENLQVRCLMVSVPVAAITLLGWAIAGNSIAPHLFGDTIDYLVLSNLVYMFVIGHLASAMIGPTNSLLTMAGMPAFAVKANLFAALVGLVYLAVILQITESVYLFCGYSVLTLVVWKLIGSSMIHSRMNINTGLILLAQGLKR